MSVQNLVPIHVVDVEIFNRISENFDDGARVKVMRLPKSLGLSSCNSIQQLLRYSSLEQSGGPTE